MFIAVPIFSSGLIDNDPNWSQLTISYFEDGGEPTSHIHPFTTGCAEMQGSAASKHSPQDAARCRAEKNLRHLRHRFRRQSSSRMGMDWMGRSTDPAMVCRRQERKGRNWRFGPLASTPCSVRWEALLCNLTASSDATLRALSFGPGRCDR